MPSIFVWKALKPLDTTKTILYYSGSNWFLEEHEHVSSSYVYMDQCHFTKSANQVIMYRVTKMPQNWVGSELLEVVRIPYQLVKQDAYGTLEQLGNWMRFTSMNDCSFDHVEKEFDAIMSWSKGTHVIKSTPEQCLINYEHVTSHHKVKSARGMKSNSNPRYKSIQRNELNHFAIVFSP